IPAKKGPADFGCQKGRVRVKRAEASGERGSSNTVKRRAGWQKEEWKAESLQPRILDQPRLQQPIHGLKKLRGGAQCMEMSVMVEIGPEKIEIALFHQALRQLTRILPIITDQRQKVQLKQTTRFADLIIPALIGAEIQIPLGVGEDWLIALHLQLEKQVLEID